MGEITRKRRQRTNARSRVMRELTNVHRAGSTRRVLCVEWMQMYHISEPSLDEAGDFTGYELDFESTLLWLWIEMLTFCETKIILWQNRAHPELS